MEAAVCVPLSLCGVDRDVFSSHFSLDPFCYPTGGVTIIIPLSQMRKLTPRKEK